MKCLVEINKSILVVDSRVISKGFDVEHRSVRRLIETHLGAFERMGFHGFQIQRNRSGREERFCYLDEKQATFLISLMKNSDIVILFKEKLVTDFFKMRNYLQREAINTSLKQKSTKTRKLLTKEWKESGIEKGSEFAFLTLEEYRLLQFEKGRRKKDFTEGEIKALMALEALEMVNLHYNPKIGFPECKDSLSESAQKVIEIKTNKKQVQ